MLCPRACWCMGDRAGSIVAIGLMDAINPRITQLLQRCSLRLPPNLLELPR